LPLAGVGSACAGVGSVCVTSAATYLSRRSERWTKLAYLEISPTFEWIKQGLIPMSSRVV
jgi:hypothetical protein